MRTSLLSSLLLASALASTSCSKDTVLAIAVSNIPDGTVLLDVITTIDSREYKVDPIKTYSTTQSATIISITIPFEVPPDPVKISITAKGTQCQIANWSGSIAAIEPATYSISAPLIRLTDDSIDQDLFTVKTIAPNNAWAAGINSTMAHWDGCYWKNVKVTTESPENIFTRLAYNQQIGLWATGSDGLLYKYNSTFSTWEIKKSARELYPSLTGASQSEWNRSMFWSDLAYIEGTAGELLVVGFNIHKAAKDLSQTCMIVRGTPSASHPEGYVFTRQDAICSTRLQTTAPSPSQPVPPQTPPSTTWPSCNSCFTPNQIASFRDGLIISGGVTLPQIKAPDPNEFGAYIKINQPSTLGNPTGRYIVPKLTNPNQELTGSSLSLWATRFDDFWVGNSRLYHISPNDKDVTNPSIPESIAPMYEDKGTEKYKLVSIWGANADDFWAIGLPLSVTSQVHHISTQQLMQSQIKAQFIDQSKFRAPMGAFRYTSIDGTSINDIWLVGYHGIRTHYDNSNIIIIK